MNTLAKRLHTHAKDPAVHVKVRWIMEISSICVIFFIMMKLDTRRKKKKKTH